ncbi:hypothetical protein ACLBWS_03685 [Brucellaceae bacterium D45D]
MKLLAICISATILISSLNAQACSLDEAYEAASKLAIGLNQLEKRDIQRAIEVQTKVNARVRELTEQLQPQFTDALTFEQSPENVEKICIINKEALKVFEAESQ